MSEAAAVEEDFDWPVVFDLNIDHKQGQRSRITVRSTDEISALAALKNVGEDKYLLPLASQLMGGYDDDDDYYDGEDD